MANSRYSNLIKASLRNERYRELLDRRGIDRAKVYPTPQMRYPSSEEIVGLQLFPHIWKDGDHYWQLAAEHYKRPTLWWVIAWFNQKPTEAHITIGDVIYVPSPLEKILDLLGV